jgi:hypothetical protein
LKRLVGDAEHMAGKDDVKEVEDHLSKRIG